MNKEIFDWEEIDFSKVNKTSGEVNTICPICSHTRKKKTDKCLGINLSKGIAHCNHCDVVSVRDDNKAIGSITYDTPKPLDLNLISYSESMLKYLATRKITEKSLRALYVTEEMHKQPALGNKVVNNIVFNAYEGSVLVNKKFRSGDKKFTQTYNTKKILYNINSIIGQDTCYIVEGEFDVLAMREIGIKNCVSLPNGANDNDDYWINSKKYIENIKRFIIATDNDEAGILVRDKIAQRLGRYRCEYLEFKHKDANGELINGTLSEAITKTIKFPVSGIFTAEDLLEDSLSLYDNGLPETIKPTHHSFDNVNDIFSLKKGHLCTVTGIPSHGKSAYVDWYVLNLVRDLKMKASFFSPEHSPLASYNTTFAEKVIGKHFHENREYNTPRMSREEFKDYTKWAKEKIYFTSEETGKTPTWDWLIDKFKEQMFNYGVDIFVVDAFNKVQLGKGNKLDMINSVLTDLTNFAQSYNVIVMLVAHPTKMRKNETTGVYDSPTLYDVSGSSDFRNQTHDGFCIYRYFGEDDRDRTNNYLVFSNLKTKMKHQGKIGASVEMEYHRPTGRFFPRSTDYKHYSMLDDNTPLYEQVATLPTISPSDAFDPPETNKNLFNEEVKEYFDDGDVSDSAPF